MKDYERDKELSYLQCGDVNGLNGCCKSFQ